jgi:hypothetical protein
MQITLSYAQDCDNIWLKMLTNVAHPRTYQMVLLEAVMQAIHLYQHLVLGCCCLCSQSCLFVCSQGRSCSPGFIALLVCLRVH